MIELKNTGLIRRVDDLGRIVIPREVRHRVHIEPGDPLEIFVDATGCVAFKRYNPAYSVGTALNDLKHFVEEEDGLVCRPEILEKIAEMEEILKNNL